MTIIICVLSVRPDSLLIDFYKQLIDDKYKIYICIDDNNYDIINNITTFDKNIHIIKIDNKICENAGFKNTVLKFRDRACSRDKALYYFSKNNIEYDFIWFIEEDVFIPNFTVIKNIDNKYKSGDLLCSSNDIIYEKQTDWLWKYVNQDIKLILPYSHSMICAIRITKNLLKCISEYAKTYKTLFLDEALFTTLSIHNKLEIINPEELSTIAWRKDWLIGDIEEDKLYHPMKNMKLQNNYREYLYIKNNNNIKDKDKILEQILNNINHINNDIKKKEEENKKTKNLIKFVKTRK
jgi:hypothetical protein